MVKQPTSKGRIRQCNERQRKKLRVAEFRECVFIARARFHRVLEVVEVNALLDAFAVFLDLRGVVAGGMDSALPMLETEGLIHRSDGGSATEEDRQAVEEWLQARPEVMGSSAGELVDGWHGWD